MITLVSLLVPPWKICVQQTHGEKPLSGMRDDGSSFPWQRHPFQLRGFINDEGASRMRVHGLLITKPCICLNYSSSQDCDGSLSRTEILCESQVVSRKTKRRFRLPNQPTDKGGRVSDVFISISLYLIVCLCL